jgi:hypothetical protein
MRGESRRMRAIAAVLLMIAAACALQMRVTAMPTARQVEPRSLRGLSIRAHRWRRRFHKPNPGDKRFSGPMKQPYRRFLEGQQHAD